MHSQIEPSSNNQITHLHSIFNHKQIVQSYPINNHSLIYHSNLHTKTQKYPHNTNTNLTQKLYEQNEYEIYQKNKKKFIEDDIFQELHSGHLDIVENYSTMLDQKEEHYEYMPFQSYEKYQNCFHGRGQKPSYHNQNMLASSSQNNDVPSRNSSLSSLSEKNQYNKVKLPQQFEKNSNKNHVKNPLYSASKRSNKKFYLGSSENQMDVENSEPMQNQFHYMPNYNMFDNYHYNRNNNYHFQDENYPINHFQNQNIYNTKPKNIPQRIRDHSEINKNNAQFTRNNAIMNPQKIRSDFPVFKRLDIDDQQEKKQRMQKIQKLKQIGCNCKKSKCLKMYCECFNLQIFCNQNCNCCGCCNQQSNDQHQKAVLDALTRNPKAFNQVTQKIEVAFNLGVQLNEVKKGCKCKKTKCQKKYCQCYNLGQACGKFCKCQGCQNC